MQLGCITHGAKLCAGLPSRCFTLRFRVALTRSFKLLYSRAGLTAGNVRSRSDSRSQGGLEFLFLALDGFKTSTPPVDRPYREQLP